MHHPRIAVKKSKEVAVVKHPERFCVWLSCIICGSEYSMQSANAERRREKSIMTVAAGPSLHTLTSGEVEIGVSADTGSLVRVRYGDWTVLDRAEVAESFRLLVPVGERRANWARGSEQTAPELLVEDDSITCSWHDVRDEHGTEHDIDVRTMITVQRGIGSSSPPRSTIAAMHQSRTSTTPTSAMLPLPQTPECCKPSALATQRHERADCGHTSRTFRGTSASSGRPIPTPMARPHPAGPLGGGRAAFCCDQAAGWRPLILLEVNVVSDSLTKWSIRSTS